MGTDINYNGIPDGMEYQGGNTDHNGNGVPDAYEYGPSGTGTYADYNLNGIPDSTEIYAHSTANTAYGYAPTYGQDLNHN